MTIWSETPLGGSQGCGWSCQWGKVGRKELVEDMASRRARSPHGLKSRGSGWEEGVAGVVAPEGRERKTLDNKVKTVMRPGNPLRECPPPVEASQAGWVGPLALLGGGGRRRRIRRLGIRYDLPGETGGGGMHLCSEKGSCSRELELRVRLCTVRCNRGLCEGPKDVALLSSPRRGR